MTAAHVEERVHGRVLELVISNPAQRNALYGPEGGEGIAAFLEKRKAKFHP